jgi:hypothetical protein
VTRPVRTALGVCAAATVVDVLATLDAYGSSPDTHLVCVTIGISGVVAVLGAIAVLVAAVIGWANSRGSTSDAKATAGALLLGLVSAGVTLWMLLACSIGRSI